MEIGQRKSPPPESLITRGSASIGFVGPDAVALFRAVVIGSALRTYAQTGLRMNRAYTPTAMLKAATGITGKTYRRGEHLKAADDIKVWCDAMRAALPVVEG